MAEVDNGTGKLSPDLLNKTPEDVSMPDADAIKGKGKAPKADRGHEIITRTIKIPAFSYAYLELISDPPSKSPLDDLTIRSYLTSAFTRFLGLTGAAIPVDILKVEARECWIRVPREDLSAVIAAVGGWVEGNEKTGHVRWRVRRSGNWLGSLVGSRDLEKVWTE